MKLRFQDDIYQLVITDHAEERMRSRGVTLEELVKVIETGKVKPKEKLFHYWVYKSFKNRIDNLVCFSVVLEKPFLIVITTLVNWRPHED